MQIQHRLKTIEAQILQLEFYMQSKISAKDWHAVQDSASDIRELEAEKLALTLVINKELQ